VLGNLHGQGIVTVISNGMAVHLNIRRSHHIRKQKHKI